MTNLLIYAVKMEIETKTAVKLDVSPNSQAWIYYVNNKPTKVRFDIFPDRSIELWLEHPSDKRREVAMLKELIDVAEEHITKENKLEEYAEQIEDIFSQEVYPVNHEEVDYRSDRKEIIKQLTDILTEVRG